MSRRPDVPGQPRTVQVLTRFTPAGAAELDRLRAAAGKTRAGYLRDLVAAASQAARQRRTDWKEPS